MPLKILFYVDEEFAHLVFIILDVHRDTLMLLVCKIDGRCGDLSL